MTPCSHRPPNLPISPGSLAPSAASSQASQVGGPPGLPGTTAVEESAHETTEVLEPRLAVCEQGLGWADVASGSSALRNFLFFT